MTHCYTHGAAYFSTFFNKDDSFSILQGTQSPQLVNMQRIYGKYSTLNRVHITPFPPRLRILPGREGRKIVKARDGKQLQGNTVFQTQQGSSEFVIACIRPVQVQTRENTRWGLNGHKTPSLAEELLALIADRTGRVNVLSLCVLLVCLLYSLYCYTPRQMLLPKVARQHTLDWISL